MSCPHIVQVVTSFSLSLGAEFWEEGSEGPTVGSCATSAVTPAVAPTVDAISCLITQEEGASSVKEHVLQANSSLFSALSSRGNSKFELRGVSTSMRHRWYEDTHHSEQKRKRICLLGSWVSLLPYSAAAGDDMAVWSADCSVWRDRVAMVVRKDTLYRVRGVESSSWVWRVEV